MILGSYVTEYYMHSLPVSDTKWWFYDMHKSIGISILMVMVLRVIWRRMNDVPDLPPETSSTQKMLARLHHQVLYVALLLMPISGFIGSKAGGHKAMWFGFFDMPDFFGKIDPLNWWAEMFHTIVSYVILVLIAVHILAALQHHFILKDNVLRRMLPFGRGADHALKAGE